jgi:hypothetical protein
MADNLNRLHVPIVLKSGSLNFLESSGPVQACNGITLPLMLDKYFTIPCRIFYVNLRKIHTNICDIICHYPWHTVEACFRINNQQDATL